MVEDVRMGNRPNLDLARPRTRRSTTTASRRRRRCRGTSPSGSRRLARGSRRCSWHRHSENHMSARSPPTNVVQAKLTWNLCSKVFHSFFDWWLLGYSIGSVPLFTTICSAVKGLLVYLHLESDHHCFTAATSAANAASSLFKSAGGLAILLAAIV